jgi:hypothetical protein
MIRANYDRYADVLYVVVGKPRPAYSVEGDDGLYYRFADDDEAPCGVTVEGYALLWRERRPELAGRIARFLNATARDVEQAISHAVSEPVTGP